MTKAPSKYLNYQVAEQEILSQATWGTLDNTTWTEFGQGPLINTNQTFNWRYANSYLKQCAQVSALEGQEGLFTVKGFTTGLPKIC